MAELTFMQKLAANEVPRRVLGAVLTVPVPGAGHVILGYPKLGAIITAVMLALFGGATLGAVSVMPRLFLACGAIAIFLLVACVISIFALPPGPKLKDGLRALWPAFVIFVAVRAAVYVVGNFAMQVAPVNDDTLAPEVRKGDTMLVHPGPAAAPGDVVFVEAPAGKFQWKRYDGAIPKDEIRGRALFVFSSASDGRGRIWRSLRK